jgi:hypothetical protein
VKSVAASGLAHLGIPEEDFNRLKALADDFVQKYAVASAPTTRTKATVGAKNDARKAAVGDARQFVKRFLNNNPLVMGADRDCMGLPIYKVGRTSTPVPIEKPDYSVAPLVGSRLAVHFHAYDADKKRSNAKPFGVHGVEIVWAILDAPPTSYDDLIHSVVSTRSPHIFQFDLSDAGKRCYFGLRWQNTRGQAGPWSEIRSAIVP